MCQQCYARSSPWMPRRGFLVLAGAAAATPVLAQVDVGAPSRMRGLVLSVNFRPTNSRTVWRRAFIFVAEVK